MVHGGSEQPAKPPRPRPGGGTAPERHVNPASPVPGKYAYEFEAGTTPPARGSLTGRRGTGHEAGGRRARLGGVTRWGAAQPTGAAQPARAAQRVQRRGPVRATARRAQPGRCRPRGPRGGGGTEQHRADSTGSSAQAPPRNRHSRRRHRSTSDRTQGGRRPAALAQCERRGASGARSQPPPARCNATGRGGPGAAPAARASGTAPCRGRRRRGVDRAWGLRPGRCRVRVGHGVVGRRAGAVGKGLRRGGCGSA